MAEQSLQSPNLSSKELRTGRRSMLLTDDEGSASPLHLISNSLASTIASRAEEKEQIEAEEKVEEVDEAEPEVPDQAEARAGDSKSKPRLWTSSLTRKLEVPDQAEARVADSKSKPRVRTSSLTRKVEVLDQARVTDSKSKPRPRTSSLTRKVEVPDQTEARVADSKSKPRVRTSSLTRKVEVPDPAEARVADSKSKPRLRTSSLTRKLEVPNQAEAKESNPSQKLGPSEAVAPVPQQKEFESAKPIELAAAVEEAVKAVAITTGSGEQKTVAEPYSILKRARVKLNSLKEDDKQAPTVIPWKQKYTKVTTVAEEKRKVFENFDKTSAVPPDTPVISESKLKKVVSQSKSRKFEDNSKKAKRDPYSSVSPKVNTRWSRMGASTEWKQIGRPTGFAVYSVALSPGLRGGKNRFALRNKSAPVSSSRPMGGSKQRIPDKLPLTIPPHRFKSPKRLNGPTRGKIVSEVTRRLYNNGLTPIQKYKNEILKQQRQMENGANSSTPYKSPLFNLHRINNAGLIGNSKQQQQGLASQTIRPMQAHFISHNSQTAAARKQFGPGPTLQTIQAPPSPFLASQVSVPNQLMEIPINGELMRAAAKMKATNVRPSPSNRSKKNGGKVQNTGDKPKSKSKAPPAPKVYNKIYIGPYSGSESEGEQKAAPKTPAQNPAKQTPAQDQQPTKKKAVKKQ